MTFLQVGQLHFSDALRAGINPAGALTRPVTFLQWKPEKLGGTLSGFPRGESREMVAVHLTIQPSMVHHRTWIGYV